jgi:hypothetical protein
MSKLESLLSITNAQKEPMVILPLLPFGLDLKTKPRKNHLHGLTILPYLTWAGWLENQLVPITKTVLKWKLLLVAGEILIAKKQRALFAEENQSVMENWLLNHRSAQTLEVLALLMMNAPVFHDITAQFVTLATAMEYYQIHQVCAVAMAAARTLTLANALLDGGVVIAANTHVKDMLQTILMRATDVVHVMVPIFVIAFLQKALELLVSIQSAMEWHHMLQEYAPTEAHV